ncbi:MAG TPA: GDSL-type esterase/lipase family protein [Planctomycetota bacterium]
MTLLLVTVLQAGSFELAEGERVLFLGNTFVERDLKHNRLETLLTGRFHAKSLIFRNLGWDGDTVWGTSRAGFGREEDGFKQLQKQVAEVKPTLIFLAYGLNESFAGEPGLARFDDGLRRLLDALAPSRARVVVLGPCRHEGSAEHTENLRLYAGALRKTADARGFRYVDLLDLKGDGPLTDNGIHLGDEGYARAALAVEAALGYKARSWKVEIDVGKESVKAEGLSLKSKFTDYNKARFEAVDDLLPVEGAPRALYVKGLQPGRYALKVDGKPLASGTYDEWARGIDLRKGPEFDRAEALRAVIAEKNRIFFDYWRPHNETYIFGFRKREQGSLQAEFPQFPALVAVKEAEIAKLRVPAVVTYTLEPEK